MYNAVFSAVMTITGLTFAAIGLLLEGRERHWIRHAQVWKSLKFRGLLPVAIGVVLTSGFVLWRIDIEGDSFSLWWWLTIVLFVASLGALGWSLVLTRRLVEPTSILERLRRRLFTEQKMSASAESSVSDYMVVVKELLIGTLGEGDTNNYRVTHETGLVNPSCPPEGLDDCVSPGFSDATRIRTVGMLAVEALGEARAQFDASSGNRTVNLICTDTMAAILDAWSGLNVAEIEAGDHRTETEAALPKVMRKGSDAVSRSLAGALGVQRPSQTLVDKLSDGLRSVLPFVDAVTAFDAIERVVSAAERAASAGNLDEASGPLGVVTPGVIERLGPKRSQMLKRIAESVVQVTTAVTAARRPEMPFAETMIPAVLKDHDATVSLLAEMQKTDNQTCTLLLRHIYGSNLVSSRRVALQRFFEERLTGEGDDATRAAEQVATWLQPVADHLARTEPSRLKDLRQHVVSALRGHYSDETNVNPVYLMAIFAAIRVERRRMRDELTPGESPKFSPVEPGTLSNELEGSRRNKAAVRRVPVSPMLWQCINVLGSGLEYSRESGQPLPFSPEVRRSIMGSLSYVVHAVDDASVEDIGSLLHDEKLIRSIETLFSLGTTDLGDISVFLDRFWAASDVALSMESGTSLEQCLLRWRWLAIRLRCESAYTTTGVKMPTADLAPDPHSGTEDGSSPEETSNAVHGLESVVGGLVDGSPTAGGNDDGRFDSIVRILRTSLSSSEPEIELSQAFDDATAAGGLDESTARKLYSALLVDLVPVWLPEWATQLWEESERAQREGDAESAMLLVRTVRSCFKRTEGSKDRVTIPTGGPFFVFKLDVPSSPLLLDAGRRVMVAMLTDWLSAGIDHSLGREPSPEELRQSANSVVGTSRRAMSEKFTGVPGINKAKEELQSLGDRLVRRRAVPDPRTGQ